MSSPILLHHESAEYVDNDPKYREATLKNAKKKQFGVADLIVEDKQTGELHSVEIDHASALLGANKDQFEKEFYNQYSPGKTNSGEEPHRILQHLLDARHAESEMEFRRTGVRFYYNTEQAEKLATP